MYPAPSPWPNRLWSIGAVVLGVWLLLHVVLLVLGIAEELWRSVLGSVSTAGPVERLTASVLARYAPHTVLAAKQLGQALGAMPATALRASWHP